MKELAKIDSFRRELAIVETIEEIKMLSTKGDILAEMAKKMNITKKGQDALGRTRIELEVKKREVIESMFPVGKSNQHSANSETLSLQDVGITYNESSDAKIIKHERDLVEEAMEEIEETAEVITPKSVAAKVRKKKKEQKRTEKSEAGAKIQSVDIDFRLGDFEDVFSDIPDGGVDCIITDPPYPYEFIECWTKLSRFAKRVLKPNGFCIAYSGQMNLPDVINRMSENLTYYWTFSLIHTGSKQLINGRSLFCGWKPILVFQNGFKKLETPFNDFIMGSGMEKKEHRWQQGKDELYHLINNFTNPGDLIIEPFAGAGTTIIAATELKRNIKAAEIDKQSYNIAKQRIWENTSIRT